MSRGGRQAGRQAGTDVCVGLCVLMVASTVSKEEIEAGTGADRAGRSYAVGLACVIMR